MMIPREGSGASARPGTRPRLVPLFLLLAMTQACSGPAPDSTTPAEAAPDALAPAGDEEGWRLLFDGESLADWRGYQRDTPPGAWRAEDGVLAFVPTDADRGDLVTREQFGDYILDLEWRVSETGNSGIIYRATEAEDAPWKTGPEMQILDDDRHPDAALGVDGNRKAGSLYDMIPATPGVVRPVGEWNHSRIVARGTRVEHWLNDQLVVEYDTSSDEWTRLYEASKFSEMPGFGIQPRGHIVLQDHGDPVWFRNIRIQPLS